jgi:NAD(P)-dependent dehydrogenase (short-subunit alcohol dehydrogenase family)
LPSGKHIVITGGGSGIGAESARALAAKCADVTIAVRDAAAGERAEQIRAKAGAGAVHVAKLDLLDRDNLAADDDLDICVRDLRTGAIERLSRESW